MKRVLIAAALFVGAVATVVIAAPESIFGAKLSTPSFVPHENTPHYPEIWAHAVVHLRGEGRASVFIMPTEKGMRQLEDTLALMEGAQGTVLLEVEGSSFETELHFRPADEADFAKDEVPESKENAERFVDDVNDGVAFVADVEFPRDTQFYGGPGNIELTIIDGETGAIIISRGMGINGL